MGFDPSTSILAGRSVQQLQTDLTNLQTAYLALTSGGKVETASYAQGDGTKAVTYTRANLGAMVIAIKEIQAQLGIISRGRRPIRFSFR